MRNLLDINTSFAADLGNRKYRVQYQQDVDPALKETARLKEELHRTGGSKDYVVAAQVPMVVLYNWGQEDGINYFGRLDQHQQMKLFRRLNDPEFKKLRVWDGHLGMEDTN